MVLFKGVTTLQDYEECLKKGLCEEHLKDIGQNDPVVLKNEFPEKAFNYIRINILYPLLFKKSPKLEKIKLLMERTPAYSKILLGGDVSEAAHTIFILDSVIIFTLCQLSQICCIGALFHMKKKNCDVPKLKSLRALLLVDQLDKTIVQYLYPVLQRNFVGYDQNIIKASHIITLIFVRNFCTKFNMKTAIENIEKDIRGDGGWENFKMVADDCYQRNKYKNAAMSYIAALFQNLYSPELYTNVAQCYLKIDNYKAAQLYAYLAVSFKRSSTEAYIKLCLSLLLQKQYEEAFLSAQYGINTCEKLRIACEELKAFGLRLQQAKEDLSAMKVLINDYSSSSNKTRNLTEKKVFNEKCQSMSVKLIDSDSAGSEEEPEVIKKSEELTTVYISDSDTSDAMESKPVTSVQEKSKMKPLGATRKKRTLSEGSPDPPVEVEMDISKINSLLKEASEALLADCGYKAVQIFRGPLRAFIESSKLLLSFEECDIVCIKYSYGIAYCKSGGYDDLQKCITILKDILEKHDSVTFPAAYYSLGLCYRKLNRFKESLHYLEIVDSFLNKGIHFKVYPWPGMTIVIQETKPDVLKILVQELIKECENPPNPDAFCRYANCEYQPTIYYTDPDFKGYVSLSCSEQCCMQYHFLCWKAMKTEKNLTDKEFLGMSCFTPDCEGAIVKIQNIDKKGDLSKEFVSDFKKNSKQKWAKWEKKTDLKDKKKKKSKWEEAPNGEMERRNSRANSESSPSPQPPSIESSAEETIQSESPEKSIKNIQEEVDCSVNSQINISSSPKNSAEEISSTSCVIEDKENSSKRRDAQESGSELDLKECMKENVYLFMDDFLQHHGPLGINDPILVDEFSCFPEQVNAIIAEYGGLGEFLKEDLRFAYVGDKYICAVSDLATAYKMYSSSSLPTDLQSLESTGDSKYANNQSIFEKTHQNTGLNPDAVEYTPSSVSKNNPYKFVASDLLIESFSIGDAPFSAGARDLSSLASVLYDAFAESEIHSSKLMSCVSVKNQKVSEPVPSEEGKLCDNPAISKYTCRSKSLGESTRVDSKVAAGAVGEDGASVGEGLVAMKKSLKSNVQSQLMILLKLLFSEKMEYCRQDIHSHLKPFAIRKLPDLASTATMTDQKLEDSSKVDRDVLSEQNCALGHMLKKTTQKEHELCAKVAALEKQLKALEVQKKECENKERDLMNGREYLLESLTEAHQTIDQQKKELVSLTSEKKSLQKKFEDLSLSLKKSEEKIKCALDGQEKQNNITLSLQNERDQLKSRVRHAELLVLHLKKTEYLKKIDEKSSEAAKKRKELTDGLSMISCNLNPVMQGNLKALTAQLLNYVNDLNAIKLNFMKKIDDDIEKVKNGTPLKEVQEIEMKELPEIPCWSFQANGPVPALDKPLFGSFQSPLNLSLNTGMPPQIPPAALLTADAPKVIPKVPAAKEVPASPIVAPLANMIHPSSMLSSFAKTDLANGGIDFISLNSQIEESFKSGMASINSFASTPYVAPSLDDDFQKKCAVFRQPDPVPISKTDIPKVPVAAAVAPPAPLPVEEAASSSGRGKHFDSLDTLPTVKSDPIPSTLGQDKKKNNYEKLLSKLKEHFPQYNQEELMSYVKEFRAQRQGKLSGLAMTTIISEISNLIKAKKVAVKKVPDSKVLPKSAKVLVNKKLVPDPKAPSEQQQSVKKKMAWGTVDAFDLKVFRGNPDDDCTICCDPMTHSSAYKVSCGHAFHEGCIRQWLKAKSNCPVCRVLLLLPEEYPSLS